MVKQKRQGHPQKTRKTIRKPWRFKSLTTVPISRAFSPKTVNPTFLGLRPRLGWSRAVGPQNATGTESDRIGAPRPHHPILLFLHSRYPVCSLSTLRPLWLSFLTVGKSRTTEGSKGSEKRLISMAFVGVARARKQQSSEGLKTGTTTDVRQSVLPVQTGDPRSRNATRMVSRHSSTVRWVVSISRQLPVGGSKSAANNDSRPLTAVVCR